MIENQKHKIVFAKVTIECKKIENRVHQNSTGLEKDSEYCVKRSENETRGRISAMTSS